MDPKTDMHLKAAERLAREQARMYGRPKGAAVLRLQGPPVRVVVPVGLRTVGGQVVDPGLPTTFDVYPDGTRVQVNPPPDPVGTRVVRQPDGTYVKILPDGERIQLGKFPYQVPSPPTAAAPTPSPPSPPPKTPPPRPREGAMAAATRILDGDDPNGRLPYLTPKEQLIVADRVKRILVSRAYKMEMLAPGREEAEKRVRLAERVVTAQKVAFGIAMAAGLAALAAALIPPAVAAAPVVAEQMVPAASEGIISIPSAGLTAAQIETVEQALMEATMASAEALRGVPGLAQEVLFNGIRYFIRAMPAIVLSLGLISKARAAHAASTTPPSQAATSMPPEEDSLEKYNRSLTDEQYIKEYGHPRSWAQQPGETIQAWSKRYDNLYRIYVARVKAGWKDPFKGIK